MLPDKKPDERYAMNIFGKPRKKRGSAEDDKVRKLLRKPIITQADYDRLKKELRNPRDNNTGS